MPIEQFPRFDGNGRKYMIALPRIHIQEEFFNDVALAHIKKQTGLEFKKSKLLGYEAQPEHGWQVVALLMTYSFKARYSNESFMKNTLCLRSDHHIGFDVRAICKSCCDYNHIPSFGLEPGDMLIC